MRVCTVCHERVPPGMPVCPKDGAPAEDPEPHERLIGQMLGEYRLKGIIGEGGMGQVYEGVQPVIGKRVAIKLLRRELASNPAEAHRLLMEARAVNTIGHRGIIDIFSFGATPDGRQYFVMEYLSGLSLGQHLKQHGALPVEDTVKLLDEVLAALGAAHAAGVIHRDLKPSNIFLVAQPDGSSFVKLLDFGIAKQAPAEGAEVPTRVSRIVGTPEYMAPEQARGRSVSARTDLYALGVVTFQMLTGRLPFEADNPFEVVNMHLNKPPPAPSRSLAGIPPELDALVLELLEKHPAKRPASAEAVRDELRSLRRSLTISHSQLMVVPTSLTQVTVVPLPETRDAEPTQTREAPREATHSHTREAHVDSGELTVHTREAHADTVELSGGTREAHAVLADTGELTRALQPQAAGRAWRVAAGAATALIVLTALVWWAPWRERPPIASPTAVVEAPRVEPSPPPAEVAAPSPPESPPEVIVQRPDPPKVDLVQARYRKLRSAWARIRGGRSDEDRRIFDTMIEQVGKEVSGGSRADATHAMNDFVQSALGGKEP